MARLVSRNSLRLAFAAAAALCAASATADMPSERDAGAGLTCPVAQTRPITALPLNLDQDLDGGLPPGGSPQPPGVLREIKMPTLLHKDFYAPADICADARANSGGKSFALVVGKTHMCDRESQVCLRTLRDVADTCNRFVHDNFAVYHTRILRLRAGQKYAQEQVGSEQITNQWAPSGGPNMNVIRLSDCKVFPRVGPPLDSNDKTQPTAERFRLMQEELLRTPGVREAMGDAANYAPGDTENNCLTQPAPTIDQTLSALDAQCDALEAAKGKPQWAD